MNKRIDKYNRSEFVGQIIDVFEDLLEEKKVRISNPEKDEAVADGIDPESICIIYGSDYSVLQSGIEEILINWGLMSDKEK